MRSASHLPGFGCCDLGVSLDMTPRSLVAVFLGGGHGAYNIPVGCPLVDLNGKMLVEVEVFRVCPPAATSPPPAKRARTAETDPPVQNTQQCVRSSHSRDGHHDQRKFGDDIAGAVMEERVALQQAQTELTNGRDSLEAAARALAAIYGPAVAAGEQDAVVELSVNGTRMTALRSTLQACPDSALAARFDESKWPTTEKDVDEHGRRIIDCKPSVFSNVLDVLRMRKRESWAGSSKTCGGAVRVVIDAADRDSVEAFINKYFLGSERFIMEMVHPSKPSTALTVPPA